MKTIRVFPRKTKLTPDDENVRVNCAPRFFDEADEVHISVLFTEDLPKAERLAKEWSRVAPVRTGGVATGERGGDFVPGMYVKKGTVITSRGCPNRCWFCNVWQREGTEVRELPITDGWHVQDDNLLRCSEKHVRNVFDMLHRQPERAEFTGGLEAAVLQDWHIDLLVKLRPKQIFFSYDTPEDREALSQAGKRLIEAGFTRASHALRTYCLIGYPRDTFEDAEQRLKECFDVGFMPMAMLYRDGKNEPAKDWKRFARVWARPAIIAAKIKQRRTTSS
jgi:hypothetical protein